MSRRVLEPSGDGCTFDVMVEESILRPSRCLRLAAIVRGAEPAAMDIAPQAAGLLAASLGCRACMPTTSRSSKPGLALRRVLPCAGTPPDLRPHEKTRPGPRSSRAGGMSRGHGQRLGQFMPPVFRMPVVSSVASRHHRRTRRKAQARLRAARGRRHTCATARARRQAGRPPARDVHAAGIGPRTMAARRSKRLGRKIELFHHDIEGAAVAPMAPEHALDIEGSWRRTVRRPLHLAEARTGTRRAGRRSAGSATGRRCGRPWPGAGDPDGTALWVGRGILAVVTSGQAGPYSSLKPSPRHPPARSYAAATPRHPG